jgi:dihydrofolate synthase/folylpolyglutamate synthase
MQLSTVQEWLEWIDSIHYSDIELGLDRIKQVAIKLDVLQPKCPVIIVGGTNGKGSTVAGLQAIYLQAGYKVGAYTSPYLFKHNEQVVIDGVMACDQDFCDAFQKVESVRDDVLLTPFEFHTLAALVIFKKADLDLWILEVGLGGRLDAVNIMDADVAVVTSIGIDHVAWLGATRDAIGYEKAGIFRESQLAVYGDLDPPDALLNHVAQLKTRLYRQGQHFAYQENALDWSWQGCDHLEQTICYEHLPLNGLASQNMAIVLMTIQLLQERMPVTLPAIRQGLLAVQLKGRIEVVPGQITHVYDVAHNPAAVAWLYQYLRNHPIQGKTWAVFAMLSDKDILASIKEIESTIDGWFIAPLTTKRGASLEQLHEAFCTANIVQVSAHATIALAHKASLARAVEGDRIVVFGSFHTVASVLR